MPHWIDVLLNLLSQFTGGRGGIDHVIVNYGIAAVFYAILLVIVRAKYADDPQPRERLLQWGFVLGLARELFMIFMATIQALGWVDPVDLHAIFPPLEHTLLDLGMIVIAAAYLRYLLDDAVLTRRYLQVAVSATLASYLITFWWWAQFIIANPTSKFGQVWPDWVFHINASLWMIVPAIYLTIKAHTRVRSIVVWALYFFFISEFLKLPDMAMGEVYEHIFAPISRVFYLIAIPMLGYVYVYEQVQERQQQKQNLESLVKSRTQELSVALADLSANNERLKEVDKVKSEFLATMSHELRTPLNSILGFTGLVQQGVAGPINDEQKRQLGMAYGSAKHLLSLINDILDLSRIEAGRMDLFIAPIDIRHVVTEATQSLEPMLAQKKLRLKIDLQLADDTFNADHKKLLQILLNLLNNAVKFTYKGEITLRVEETKADLKISVKDTGCGIRQDTIPQLFNAFRQISSTDHKEHGGSGLGLYLSQKLVQLMGGKIWVESEYGLGSIFTFTLPKVDPNVH